MENPPFRPAPPRCTLPPMAHHTITFSQKVRDKLAALPGKPGVYLMRNSLGRIIYVGKAASLRNRVSSYFRPATFAKADPKLRGLIRSIDDLDFIVLRSEAEATLTESRLIKDYRPRYNIELKDDKRFLLLKVRPDDPCPRFEAVRLRKDDGARYWGPFASAASAWASLEFVEREFGIRHCAAAHPGPDDHKHCIDDVVRFCAAPCIGKTAPEDYRAHVLEACAFLDGDRPAHLETLKKRMEEAAAEMRFEKAAALRDWYLLLVRGLRERAVVRKTPPIQRAEADAGLAELQRLLALPAPPHRMECYDISNISGTLSVASQVVSIDGVPTPSHYRMYRIKTVEGSNDPASMAEVIRRRFTRALSEGEPLPDLVMVDGGLTQLRAARAELDALGLRDRPRLTGIAKQYEELYHDPSAEQPPLRFSANSPALHVIQRLRDESHRFALTYHRKLRARLIRESVLDDVPGIGAKRKAQLLAHFGSLSRMKAATLSDLESAPGLSRDTALLLHAALHPEA